MRRIFQVLALFALGFAGASVLPAQTATDLIKQGIIKQRAGDLDGAIKDYTSAIELEPNRAQAYLERADAEYFKRDLDKAFADANTSVRLNPDYPGGYIERGRIRTALRDLEGSAYDIERAIRLNPSSAMAFNNRGYLKVLQHDLKGALADYDHAISLQGDLGLVYLNRCAARYANHDVAGAKADIQRYIELMPKSPWGYAHRGTMEWEDGDYDASIADASRAIRLDPGVGDWYFQRGNSYLGKRDFAASLADTDHYLASANPDDDSLAYARYFRHVDLLKLGRAGEDDLAKFVPAMKEEWSKYVGLYLTGNLSREDFKKRALVAADKDQERDQLCECYYYLGIVDLSAGRTDAAQSEFRSCLETGQTRFVEYMLAKGELAAAPH
jgi:lipoprotein NlpI